MRKSLAVFRRDVMRIVRARKTWVIVLGVLITPALYAWFNINAFWDPYANTGAIRVAVVNLDEGATSDLTGPTDVGAQVVDQLRDDHQLGWQFMNAADADDALQRGDVYATITIPADFSADLLTITSGHFAQPALTYRVNEKANAIAPKITDVGASEIDKHITSAFVEQVADAATAALKGAGEDVEQNLENARSDGLNAFDQASQSVGGARADLAALQLRLADARSTLDGAGSTLGDIGTALTDTQTAIGQAQTLVAQAQQEVLAFTDSATAAYVQGVTLLADASAKAHESVTSVTLALGQANTRVGGAIDDITAIVDANADAIQALQEIVDAGGLDPAVAQRLTDAIAALRAQNDADQQLLADLGALNTSVGGAVTAVQSAADALDAAAQTARTTATDLRTALLQSVPALSSAMSALSSSAGAFSAALGAQQGQLTQVAALLRAVDTQLSDTGSALTAVDGNLAGIQSSIATARTDVLALGAASAWDGLRTVTGLDPQQIAHFIAAPVEVTENVVFPVDSYGSAMAALFTNLSLWIGAFVLMVIFKIEVDTEGVAPVSVGQAYVGRFLFFAVLAVAQALIVCIGNLVIGVQTASAAAFVGTGVLIALAYISIIYALCVAFGHVGRGLCILLVIMQIPGASGLYPIELMPPFFRGIYPFLPFTYGIDAMRETIAGFYGMHWWRFMGVLAIFVALAWLVGIVLRRGFSGFTIMFNREIAATGLLIGENVQVVGRGYRLTDLFHALANREAYRADLTRRAHRFTHRYPTLVRSTLVVGLAGAVVLGLIAWLLTGQEATLLFVWVLWMLVVIGTLVTIEYVSQSFVLAEQVAGLDDAALRTAVLSHGAHLIAPEVETAAEVESGKVPSAETDAAAGPSHEAETEPETGASPSAEDPADDELTRLFADPASDLPASPDGSAAPADSDRSDETSGGERA